MNLLMMMRPMTNNEGDQRCVPVSGFQLGGELQDAVLGHLRPLRGALSGDQQRTQVHREHRLRALRCLQRHHGGGASQHAHRHDQQLLPGDRGTTGEKGSTLSASIPHVSTLRMEGLFPGPRGRSAHAKSYHLTIL